MIGLRYIATEIFLAARGQQYLQNREKLHFVTEKPAPI